MCMCALINAALIKLSMKNQMLAAQSNKQGHLRAVQTSTSSAISCSSLGAPRHSLFVLEIYNGLEMRPEHSGHCVLSV